MNGTNAKSAPWWVNVIVPTLIITIIAICYQAMANYLSVYVLQYLKGSATAFGMVGTGWTIIALVMRPATGPLSQKFGSKAMVIFGMTIFAAMIACCGIFLTFTGFVFFRLLQCIGHSTSYTAANSLAAEASPKEHLGLASALFIGIPQAVCIAGGPLLAEFLIGDDQNWFRFFVGIAAIMVVGIVITIVIIPGKKKQASGVESATVEETVNYDENGTSYTGIWKLIEKTALPVFFTQIVACMAHCTLFFLTAFVAATYDGVSAAVFFTAQAVTELLGKLVIGPLQDKKGLNIVLTPCCVLCFVVYICIARGMTSWVLLGLLYGIGQSGIKSPLNAAMLKACPANRVPVANGTFQLANAIGLGLATLVGGIIIDAFGFTGLWYYCAIMHIVIAVMGIFLIREKAAK